MVNGNGTNKKSGKSGKTTGNGTAHKNRIASVEENANIVIPAPDLATATFLVRGTAPYVQNKFSEKSRHLMMETQAAGSQAKSRKKREPKDFEAAYEDAIHVSDEGWYGIPAPAFRSAMIDACRLVGFKMTNAKCSVFIEADGIDRDDGTPLVAIEGKPERLESSVRNQTGVADVRVRPMWRQWSAHVRVRWDRGQFSATDVANLLLRAGMQVGVGEGRPFSKNSHGQGWGTFTIAEGA